MTNENNNVFKNHVQKKKVDKPWTMWRVKKREMDLRHQYKNTKSLSTEMGTLVYI